MAYESRSSTAIFLLGQTSDHIPTQQLPTNHDVLKFLFYKKQEYMKTSKKPPPLNSLVTCEQGLPEVGARCKADKGCQEGSPCIIRAVKEPWQMAGIAMCQDCWIL